MSEGANAATAANQGGHGKKPKPATSWAITNEPRQRVGDIYNPGHGRRLQIRNNSRQIIRYIERDGTVRNTSR